MSNYAEEEQMNENFILPWDLVNIIKTCETYYQLRELFSSLNHKIKLIGSRCQRASAHDYVDFFCIHKADTSKIYLTRFDVCRYCGRTNMNHMMKITLSFGDLWYHSINEQDEPPRMTGYGKSVLKRAINADEYETIITAAMDSDMRYHNCFRYSTWSNYHNMKKLMKPPY